MEDAEVAFIRKKVNKDLLIYCGLYVLMILVSLGIAYAGGWKKLEGEEIEFHPKMSLSILITLLSLSTLSVYLPYRKNLQKLRRDTQRKLKTIEQLTISNKQFIPSSRTFYFYLPSKVKYTIEVSEEDYNQYQIGDEICIEYSKYGHHYFGYF